MENGNYDIEEVKGYFKNYLFPYYLRNESDFILEQRIMGMKQRIMPLIFGMIAEIMLGVGIYLSQNPWDTLLDYFYFIWILFILSFLPTLLVFISDVNDISNYNKYKALIDYIDYKKALEPFLGKLKISTNRDIFTDRIDPIHLNEIYKIIHVISNFIKLTTWPLMKLQKVSIGLPNKVGNFFQEFSQREMIWLDSYMHDFRETLRIWIEIHVSELTSYQKKELDKKNEELFSMVSSRMSSHVENLEKVRVRL